MIKKRSISNRSAIAVIAMITLFLLATIVYSARQPAVSGDNNAWGTVLNDYLNVTLTESGSIKSDVNNSISLWNSSATGIFPRNMLAKVGIGTQFPSEILAVIGNVSISGNFTISNLFNFSATTGILMLNGSIYSGGKFFVSGNEVQIEGAAYKTSNLSGDLSGGAASTIVTSSLTSDNIVVNKNLFIVGNISNININHLNINGSLYPALDNSFDVGNGTLRWRNGNFSGTIQAGFFSGDGNKLSNLPQTFDLRNISNYTEYMRYSTFSLANVSNYTTDSAWNNSIALWNLTNTRAISPSLAEFINLTGRNLTANNITATRFTGKLDCGMIDGGSDSDYCSDATGADASVYNRGNFTYDLNNSNASIATWTINGTFLTPRSYWLVHVGNLNATNLNATSIFQNGAMVRTVGDFDLRNISNYTNKLTNNSDAIFDELNTTNNVFVQGLLNATKLNGSISCNMINDGSDSDYCSDATGADASVYNRGNFSFDLNNSNASIASWNFSSVFKYIFTRDSTWAVRIGNTNSTNVTNDTLVVFGNTTVYGNLNATTIGGIAISSYNQSVSLDNYQKLADAFNLANNASTLARVGNFDLKNVSNYTTDLAFNASIALWNITNPRVISPNTAEFVNLSGRNLTANNITAVRFTGSINCGMIDGGGDSDFCNDATASDTSVYNRGNFTYDLNNSNASIALFNTSISGSNTFVFFRNALAWLGIGTSTPTHVLKVIGNVSFDGNFTVNNTINFTTTSNTGEIRASGKIYSEGQEEIKSGNTSWASDIISNSTIQRQAPAFNTANNLTGNSFFASFFGWTNWSLGFGNGGNSSWQREATAYNYANNQSGREGAYWRGLNESNYTTDFNWNNSIALVNQTIIGGKNKLFLRDILAYFGIGTANPNVELEVVGSVRVSGSLNATTINATNGVFVNATVGNITSNGGANITGGLSVKTLNAGSCDLKADGGGNFYCGTDATSGESSSAYFTKTNFSDSFGSGGNNSWQREDTAFKISNGTSLPFSNFQIGNVSNYTEYMRYSTFSIAGNISNYTQYIHQKDFSRANFSNYTTDLAFNDSIALWNFTGVRTIQPKIANVVNITGNLTLNNGSSTCSMFNNGSGLCICSC